MTGLRITACLLAFFVAGSAAAKTVSGTWKIQDLVLHIYDCRSRVCGRIVGIEDPARRRSDCGRIIVWGLAGNGPNKWDGGSILDPDDNDVYQLSAVFQSDGTLHARIYKDFPMLGQTEILRRVDLRSLRGQC
jgi:uncharacterized protein (DUF2147 family)